jgi:uncharacterized membrane protein YdjX (TVP38/TMEM64 family)
MTFEKYKNGFGLLLLIMALAIIWYLGRSYHIDSASIQDSLKKFPLILSVLTYIALYVIVTFFIFFSKDVFWLLGAVLFGAGPSTLFICIAETINAVILFNLSRKFGRAYVENRLAGKYKYLDEKLGRVSFFWLFIFRAAPLIPYRFLDLAAGLTSIKFGRYLVAVVLGSPIKMFWIQYILAGVGEGVFKDPASLTQYFLNNRALFMLSFIYCILIVAVIIKLKYKGKILCL